MAKTASTALINFMLSSDPYIGADLYVFTLISGVKIFVTSLDRNVTYTGIISSNPDFGTNTYLSLGQTGSGAPMIQRSKVSMGVGLTPSKVDLEIFAIPGTLVQNQEILVTMAQGLWANAGVWIRRAWLLPSDKPASWNTPWPSNLGGTGDGTLIWFGGNVGKIDELGPLNCKFEARGVLWQLNRPFPKNVFGPACYHKLFDDGCALNPAAFQASGTVLSGSTTTVINTGLSNDSSLPGAPVYGGNPISSTSTNVTLPATTYFVVATYLTSHGETVASAEWSLPVAPNRFISVASPPSAAGATAWNVYVGTESGNEQRQNDVPLGIGSGPWVESTNGIQLNGLLPPAFPTNGWWSLGTVSITYLSGTLSGQTKTGVIESSDASGALTLRVPLPQTPAVGDLFTVFPGCDKQMSTCGATTGGGGKFNNIIHFGGYPFTPVPESGA